MSEIEGYLSLRARPTRLGVDGAGVRRTFEHHPRHGFTVRGEPLLRAHGRRVHGCRTAILFLAGFGQALKTGPWRGADRRGGYAVT